MKKIMMIFGTLLIIYSLPSWSNCSNIAASVPINTSSLIVQRDVAVGSRLAVQDFTSANYPLFNCGTTTGTLYFGVKATTTYSTTLNGVRVYKTDLPGIGVQLGGLTKAGLIGGWVGKGNTIDGNVNQTSVESYVGPISTVYGGAVVAFYKIGEVSSGTLNQTVGKLIMGDGKASGWASEINVSISGLSVTALACSLTTPTVAAPLGNIYATEFTGVGSTAGNNDFQLGLNCAAGTKVNVTMNGTQNADTANTSVLALTGAGSAGVAKGVGAQILYNNAPLNIGSKLALKTSAGGIETFPFKARYYQTLSNVSAGSANATATLDITYQ
ncbi:MULTISPECIES: fimbrial protein [unclassified Serratia (in: enterobacteria)]|uniref:fimbrial protein n=1 Tax=unclassified Serratia (in: enterobacteria) TaxID=2647522 RepID=UPI00046934A3|nr:MULTISPECIES: fimbrial protein [unclassified Serratia (in: enterobacteria)]